MISRARTIWPASGLTVVLLSRCLNWLDSLYWIFKGKAY